MIDFSLSHDQASLFFDSTAGQYLQEWEQKQHDLFLTNVFGYYAIQIGLPQVNFLRKNRIRHHVSIANSPTADIIGCPEALPLETASMDLVVLPHQLEFSENPHQILREAARVLMPEGKLMITGFNPMSLWGIYQRLSTRQEREELFPWNGHFIGLSRLKDWLALLNLEITGGAFGCYRPPNLSSKWVQRTAFLEKAGNRWWPTAGAIYTILATKKVYGMRIMPTPWQDKQTLPAEKPATILPSQTKKQHESNEPL